jgi:hypothetical protein
VVASKDQQRDCGGGKGEGDGDTTEVHVDAMVPATLDLGGREHAFVAAHVVEASLASAVGTTSRNMGDMRGRALVPQDSVEVWWPVRHATT